jgi:hypothetical protein
MRNLIILLFVVLSFCVMCDTTNAHWPWQNHQHPHSYRYNPPVVYYQPQVVWLPQGTTLNVGPVYVDPYRRYVRVGVNYGFYHIPQVQTFNFYNGQMSNGPR